MNLADVRLVKGMLFGILAGMANSDVLCLLMGVFAIGYLVASGFTKEPPATPASGGPRDG